MFVRWVTALELAKAKAIRTMESEEEEEMEEVSTPPDNHEVQNVFRMLSAKLEDMQTCCELINKHGNTLQVWLSFWRGSFSEIRKKNFSKLKRVDCVFLESSK